MKQESHQLRNKWIAILVVTAILCVVLFGAARHYRSTSAPKEIHLSQTVRQELYDRQIVPLLLGKQRLWVEVVTTPESITQGLSDRSSINQMPGSEGKDSPSQGMLFVLPEARIPTFWMKDMLFSLDMIWIKDGEIVDITENVPHPTSPQESLPLYSPNQAVDMVLEVPSGSVAVWQLQPGDTLLFPTLDTSDGPDQ